MPTFSIPHVTLQPPGRTADNPIGPFAVSAHMSSFALSVPLTQATGAGNSFFVSIERSLDRGLTWQRFSGFGGSGGADGSVVGCSCNFWKNADIADDSFPAMSVRVVVDVVGAALPVGSGGTLVVS